MKDNETVHGERENKPPKKPIYIKIDGELKPQENKYYGKIAERYRSAGFIMIILFVLVFGFIFIRYSDYITYDNFVYLVRDFQNSRDSSESTFTPVSVSEADTVFDTFRDGIVLSDKSHVKIYDSSGTLLVENEDVFSSPAISSGEKFSLVYDLGGKKFSLYNSVTKVLDKKTENPVLDCSVSDSGAFLVCEKSDRGKYAVRYYSSSFKNTMTVYKDKYVIDSQISRNGEYFVLISVFDDSTGFGMQVSFYRQGEENVLSESVFQTEMPLIAKPLGNDCFAVFSDGAVRIFSNRGELTETLSLDREMISLADSSERGLIFSTKTNGTGSHNNVYFISSDGVISEPIQVDGVIISLSASESEERLGTILEKDKMVIIASDGSRNIIQPFSASKVIDFGKSVAAVSDGKLFSPKTENDTAGSAETQNGEIPAETGKEE